MVLRKFTYFEILKNSKCAMRGPAIGIPTKQLWGSTFPQHILLCEGHLSQVTNEKSPTVKTMRLSDVTRLWMIRLGQYTEPKHHLRFLRPVSKLF